MTEQINKVYNLKKLELAILFSLKGIKEIYGFDLNVSESVDRSIVNQTLFELSRKNIITIEAKKIKIHNDIERILEGISLAEKILIYTDRDREYPEQCIYLGEGISGVRLSVHSNTIVRMEIIDRKNLPGRILQMGLKLEQIVTDDILFQDGEQDNHEIRQIAEAAFGKEKNLIFEKAHIRSCLIIISLATRKKETQLLLVSKGFGDYITESNDITSKVYVYSEKKLLQILYSYIEGGIK